MEDKLNAVIKAANSATLEAIKTLFQNLDKKVDELLVRVEIVEGVDDKVNDFIHTSKKLGVPIHDDIKIHKPFKQIRQEIIETTSPDNSDEIKFSDDYSWVKYKNESIFLKGNQIKVLKLLHESYMNGEPGMSWDSIRDKMDESLPEGQIFNPESMYQVFKGNPKAWKILITNPTKGFYRINLP